MLTASELGLTPEEFEAAMNVERIYSVVSKSECHNCGKTPVTHADTTLWKLFCNKCGKQHAKARKISITNFKSSEIDRFERDILRPATQNYRREPSPKHRHQASKKSKKSKKRQRRYTSSSSSSDFDSSSISSSSSYVKKKSKSSKRGNKHRDTSPPPQITFEDPINPPSAFGGAGQQTSGMAAIKSNEVRYMQHLPPSISQPTMQQQQQSGPLHPFLGQSATPTQSQAWQAPGYPAPQERPPFHMVSPPRGSFAMNLPPGAPPQLSAPSYPMVNQQQRVASSWSQPPMMGSSNQWGQDIGTYNTPPRISTSNGAANPFRKTNMYPMPKARTNPYLSNQNMQTYRIPSPIDSSSKYPWNNALAAQHKQQSLYKPPALPPPTNDRTWC